MVDPPPSEFPLRARGRRPPADPSTGSSLVSFAIFPLFSTSQRVRGDAAVLACSPERKDVSFQAAGLRDSAWCLTASHAVSAYDSLLCQMLVLGPPPCEMSDVEFCWVQQHCVHVSVGSMHIFEGGGFLCLHSLHTHTCRCLL